MLLSHGRQQQQQQKYLNSFNYLSAYVGGEEAPARFVGRCWGGGRRAGGVPGGEGKVGVDTL